MIAGSFGVLDWYANAPGEANAVASAWPLDSTITRGHDRPTVLMFIHPHCPCTRASINELARINTHSRGLADMYAVFVVPSDRDDDWARTALWEAASDIPDVRLLLDRDGAEARRFGATTSGHVLIHGADGHLQFCGGITGARGHEGDNAGASAVYAVLRWGETGRRETFVFGCSLF